MNHRLGIPVLPLALLAVAATALSATSAQADFGFRPGAEGFDATAIDEGGATASEAGSHPYSLTTAVNFKLGPESPGQPGVPFSDGDLRDLRLELPPGLIEDPAAIPRCSLAAFQTPRSSPFEASRSGESCPDKTQLGVVAVRSSFSGGSVRSFGVFNLAPPPGAPSQIGFAPYGMPIVFTSRIRDAGGEYGLTLEARNVSQALNLSGLEMTIWGVPWGASHDGQRGDCLNEAEPSFPWAKCSVGRPALNPPQAYLTLPTSCNGPLTYRASADSWQQPAPVFASALSHDEAGNPVGLKGCGALPFASVASAAPSSAEAASPSGFDFNLAVAGEALTSPLLRAVSQIGEAVVTLPEGMTLDPSLAAGLGACAPAQYAAETAASAPGAGCPNDSKIGDFTVKSPLFEVPVKGSIYLAEPDDPATPAPGSENPFDSLLAVYLIAKLPERGVIVKVAGKLSADPANGRLVATFEGLPQLPYSNLAVHFREGQRAPLLTPPACGSYTTMADLVPWSDPKTTLHDSSSFQISAGAGGGPCPSGAAPPFHPAIAAGSFNANAGSYTPFYLRLTRTDAEQEITSYSAVLPPGLLGKIAAIPYCPEAAIEAAKQTTGTEEAEHPSCPAASQIGRTVAGYGVGPALAYAPGRLYLAGPYHGSAFSVVAIDSATVGPFDLGVVIVRSAIRIDPFTAQVSIDSAASDPIPHILAGIPIHLRDIRVYIDRPGLMLNPTSCEPLAVASTLSGSGARFSDPSDDSSVTLSDRFQASNCAALGFAPRLGFRLRGGTGRGDHPALHALYRPRPGDANIGTAAVTLPPSEFLEQGRIHAVCTKAQLAADACPPGSAYGHARVFTPLLSRPLEGPVYLGTGFGHVLPDVIVALRGDGVAIDLDGRIDSAGGGIRVSFEGLPDAPVAKFALTMFGGRRGILVNSAALCASSQLATARLAGHNNRGEALRPRLRVRCPKRSHRHRRQSAGRGAGA